MATKYGRKRNAWVIVADTPRPPFHEVVFGGVPPGVPLAVLPVRTSREKVQLVVDAFVQNFNNYPSDMEDYLKRERPYYAAKAEVWGQVIIGGYNPYVEAFQVDDLRVATDTETGEERFEFTRKTPQKPQWLHEQEVRGEA